MDRLERSRLETADNNRSSPVLFEVWTKALFLILICSQNSRFVDNESFKFPASPADDHPSYLPHLGGHHQHPDGGRPLLAEVLGDHGDIPHSGATSGPSQFPSLLSWDQAGVPSLVSPAWQPQWLRDTLQTGQINILVLGRTENISK